MEGKQKKKEKKSKRRGVMVGLGGGSDERSRGVSPAVMKTEGEQ